MKRNPVVLGAAAAALALSLPGVAYQGGTSHLNASAQSDKIIRIRRERSNRRKSTRAERRAANRERIRSFRDGRRERLKKLKARQNPLIEGMTNWQNTRFWREFVSSGAKRKDIESLAEKWSKQERSGHAVS